jgi:phosphoribosyl 1,2-cyclic phosphodiesterase
MEVVVLGCGPSSSVPSVRCLLTRADCAVCRGAQMDPTSKNRRLNPSLLVRDLARGRNVLVDCGKTFRETALRLFPTLGVATVHAVVLTHCHADACLGMDDLREVQAFEEGVDPVTGEARKVANANEPLHVHCSPYTAAQVRDKFRYLIEKKPPPLPASPGVPRAGRPLLAEEEALVASPRLKPLASPGMAPLSLPPSIEGMNGTSSAYTPPPESPASPAKPFRWIAQVRLEEFAPWRPFVAAGIEMRPIPVIHGAGYTSFGFEFGHEFGARFVYISDVSDFTDETRAYLNDKSKGDIDVLVMDALYIDKFHSTHMNLVDVISEIETIRPRLTLLTGMSHDYDYPVHSELVQQMGRDKGLNIQMPYDGLVLSFPHES